MTVPFPPAATNVPPLAAEDPAARARRRRAERVRMLGMVFASYCLDAGLLAALSLAGAVPWPAALAYGAIGGIACLAFHLALRGGWSERFADPYLTGWQMGCALALQLGTMWLAPQAGMLPLSVIFLVFAFSALRLTLRQLLPQWIAVCAGLVLVIGLADMPPSVPRDTPWQAAISALWLSLAIGRCTFVGLYGSSVRELLGTRNRQLADTRDALQTLASRDELTGALNRRAIMELLREAIAQGGQHGGTPAVALLDLDHFKQVNDRHGHLVGDAVLRRFVQIAAGSLRSADRLGRYGGEEFLLLLGDAPADSAAGAIAERVRHAVEADAWEAIAPGLRVTVSIGMALRRPGETPEQLLTRADEALYAAKASGRNQVVHATWPRA